MLESGMTRPCPTHPHPPPRRLRELLVSLATYNEAGNLRPLVETIRQFAPHGSILIIDDNSPDGTGRIADELARNAAECSRDPPAGQAGPGNGDARRDAVSRSSTTSTTCSTSTPISAIRPGSSPTC